MAFVRNSDEDRALAAEKLGFSNNRADVLDDVNREDYDSEGKFMDALVDLDAKRNSKDYLDRERWLRSELRKVEQKKQEAADQAAWERYRETAVISKSRNVELATEARSQTDRALRTGKISANDYQAVYNRNLSALVDKEKSQLATNASMNDLLRRSWRKATGSQVEEKPAPRTDIPPIFNR